MFQSSINKSMISGVIILSILFMAVLSSAKEMTLNEAIKTACEKSSRGEIITGDLEVAEQNYHAEKINFYLPEISINGNIPVYNVNESFSNVYGQSGKILNRRTNLNYNANIDLRQSLITGGELTLRSELVNNRAELPQSTKTGGIEDVIQKVKQGQFNFTFTQPILKPSEPKNRLKNKSDDLEIARLQRIEALTSLREEVIEAYFGVLATQLDYDISRLKLQYAREKSAIDSIKLTEEVLSEEEWLLSSSDRLDAELSLYDVENKKLETNRELALLLDYESADPLETQLPVITETLSEKQKNHLINNWDSAIPVIKARYNFEKAERQANYLAASHGLTGTFSANYNIGRGEFISQGLAEDNNTDSWGVSVNFTLPLWDGGSTGASIKAEQLNAKKSEMEYERVKKNERAVIVSLLNQVEISTKKVSVISQQVELAKSKLDIAKYRHEDGQISNLEYFDSQVYYLETKKKYVEELKTLYINKNKLEGKYSG